MDKQRRSERLKKTTIFGLSKVTNAMLVNQKGMMLLPSSIQAIPAPNLKKVQKKEKVIRVLSEVLDNTKSGEALRLYHAQLYLLNSIYHPDQSDLDWQVEDIEDWMVRKHDEAVRIFLLIHWIGGDK